MEQYGRSYTQPKGRITGFDFLRGLAILLTLCRHSTLESTNILKQIGWVGVHIFFVLSSFLILNILLQEFYLTGKINYYRFFIRRALKIYPLYYLFILILVYKNRDIFLSSIDYRIQVLSQIFHIQNYTGIIWYHTWSLAAEEHFYIGMSIILSIYLFFSKTKNFHKLAFLFLLVIVIVPFLRFGSTQLYKTEWFLNTHFIMDSFAFGALLALCKFVSSNIFLFLIKLKHYLLIPIFLLLIPLFLLPPGDRFMNSIGFTMNYLAATLMIVYVLSIEYFFRSKNIFSFITIQPLASIGIASYSIYLFHKPIKTIIYNFEMRESFKLTLYFLTSILAGKLIWYLIERPIASYKSTLR